MKKLAFLASICFMVGLIAGCTATPTKSAQTDDLGRTITLDGIPARIVSLAPSNTEILFALGLGDKVVATDDYSDYPKEAVDLPNVGAAFPGFSIESIVTLKPDLVIAFGYQLPDYVAKLDSLGIKTVVLAPKDISGVMNNIELVGSLTGTGAKAKELTSDMKKRLDAVSAKIKGVARPRVFWEFDATDPGKPWTAGPNSFNDALINLAGGQNVGANGPTSSWQMSAEDIVRVDPQIILLDDYQFGTTVEGVGQRPGWNVITAVKNKAVYPITDSNLTDRCGPRVIEGLELLAKTIHPELYK
jgi:iron complex transport system substrate-binding protein